MVKTVVAQCRYAEDLPEEFHYSSMAQYGGSAHKNDRVVIRSGQIGNILAFGTIVDEGNPREEIRRVQVDQRFL